ncbi:hypothetical protein G6F56_006015 [Rhizopus delemar]|uniref:Peptidase S1 domain-containing protein n=1 Tax=Rhizopus stolonifer TaxID=4846 RepID=A0A367JUL6_RHIST|nr:hypothetical protein G6F56_006015 [Rhizopus delemar]RCH93606.1 hypothetical protein CU098_010442 [Rhizopus stolonifer]
MLGNPHLCGGTLLSYDPAFVLTAAHCVADALPDHSSFVSYHDVKRAHQKKVGVSSWSIHPLYNVSLTINPSYDVAIIRLDQPLAPSRRVRRVPLWPPDMNPTQITKGELVGFGYTSNKEEQAQILQKIELNITLFDQGNIQARSNTERNVACHGDSGGPLVVHHDQIPFVIGSLVRIYGARDTERLTCPVPLDSEIHWGKSNKVVESFVNTASVLDWISQVTALSLKDLTDPGFVPPSSVVEEPNEIGHWHIGGVVDQNGLLSNTTGWIGAVMPDYKLLDDSWADSLRPSLYILIILFCNLFVNCI